MREGGGKWGRRRRVGRGGNTGAGKRWGWTKSTRNVENDGVGGKGRGRRRRNGT